MIARKKCNHASLLAIKTSLCVAIQTNIGTMVLTQIFRDRFCGFANLSYLCTNGTEKHISKHRQNSVSFHLGRSDSLVDVSWRRPLHDKSRADGRDELDMDATVFSFWHPGSDVPWMAMETDAGAYGRKTKDKRLYECCVPVVCCQPGDTSHRGVFTLCRLKEVRRDIF